LHPQRPSVMPETKKRKKKIQGQKQTTKKRKKANGEKRETKIASQT